MSRQTEYIRKNNRIEFVIIKKCIFVIVKLKLKRRKRYSNRGSSNSRYRSYDNFNKSTWNISSVLLKFAGCLNFSFQDSVAIVLLDPHTYRHAYSQKILFNNNARVYFLLVFVVVLFFSCSCDQCHKWSDTHRKKEIISYTQIDQICFKRSLGHKSPAILTR